MALSTQEYPVLDEARAGLFPAAPHASAGAHREDTWTRRLLPWFAKLVVLATFVLIFRGALVTTFKAGMAVPDWPLSFGSLNPAGWWHQLDVWLEHSHRLLAMGVGLLTAILCTWIWGKWQALAAAAVVSAVLPPVAGILDAPAPVIMHLAIWPAAVVFIAVLVLGNRGRTFVYGPALRWLGVAAFVGVCIQATFGGLRVTQETAGALDTALVLRVAHGTFAQLFLGVLVAIATLLSPVLNTFSGRVSPGIARSIRNFAWVVIAAILLQLIVGAVMRHLDAGLAITTFPQAAPDGSWLPASHDRFTDINFTHTRVGAILVTVLVLTLVWRVLRSTPREHRLTRPAWALMALVFTQFAFGIFVIWHQKPRTLTTLHVVNGAIILATTLLLALRASRAATASNAEAPDSSISPSLP